MPENTIAAFDAARALGARGIECHVRCTADNVPIVQLSDAHQSALGNVLLSQINASDILPHRGQGSKRLLLLSELFDYIAQQTGTHFYIEITRHESALLQHIASAINAIHAWNRVCIIGEQCMFADISEIRALYPELRIGACIGVDEDPLPESSIVFVGWHRGSDTDRAHFRKTFSLPKLRKVKRRLESHGYEVIGRVINEQEEMEFFLAADFDNIVTDNVPLATQYFK